LPADVSIDDPGASSCLYLWCPPVISERLGVNMVRLALEAGDPVTRAGLHRFLGAVPAMRLVRAGETADVRVVACDRLTGELESSLCASGPPVVLIVDSTLEREWPLPPETRIVGVRRRDAVTPDRLVRDVRAAAASPGRPLPDEETRPVEEPLAAREIAVLRLAAEGLDTAEIAASLHCTERFVKRISHRLFARLGLKNRTQAVAYAIRRGLI
jgi:DNA-binding CsgD family transcriptional regulator